MSNQKNAYYKGLHAETFANDFLLSHNYHILAQRYKSIGGEIDIIALKQNYLVFVEVKTRNTIDNCLLSISKRQQLRIINSANCFIADNFNIYKNFDMRFDVIAIDKHNKIEHLKNVFIADYT